MLEVCSIFKEISSWARVTDLQIVHFYSKRGFITDLKNLSNKIVISFMKFIDKLLLK